MNAHPIPPSPAQDALALVGRILLAVLFIPAGFGKLTGFGYLIEFEEVPNPVRDTTGTFGARFQGEKPLAKLLEAHETENY